MHWWHTPSLSGVGIFLIYSMLSVTLWDLFQIMGMHSTMHQERSHGVGTHNSGEGEVSCYNNSSDHKCFFHIWKEESILGRLWPRLTISVDQTRECYTTKIPACFFGFFFSPPVYYINWAAPLSLGFYYLGKNQLFFNMVLFPPILSQTWT